MYKIVSKTVLSSNSFAMDILAPQVAKKAIAGQFCIVKVDEDGERIPLTLADWDVDKGTCTIVCQSVGFSTRELDKLEAGDYVTDFVGPLGEPTNLKPEWKRVIGVAGGIGAAPVYPQLKALAQKGVKVDVIIGGRSKEFVLWADRYKEFCDNVYIATDNGDLGTKGFVTDVLQKLIDDGEHYDEVIAIGPVIMMKNVVRVTKQYNLPTSVSLNPIMVDGTGMCGCCRVTVDGKIKFACVDGPDFDGLQVDFDELMHRQKMFKEQEHVINENADRICNLLKGVD